MAGLAQLVERLVYTEYVGGSSPSSRTTCLLSMRRVTAGRLLLEDSRKILNDLPAEEFFR